MRRAIYRVKPVRGGSYGWVVVGPPNDLVPARKYEAYKAVAVSIGRRWARRAWKNGHPSQLVVHKRDGKIAFEATYGHDPKRYRS